MTPSATFPVIHAAPMPRRRTLPAALGRNLLTTPVIYSLAVPLLLLDLWVTAYQWLCFPIYGIGRVRRRDYFTLDRHRLPYLTLYEKANCVYCSYATGLIAYVREVTARTEQYWCPIKHQRRPRGAHRRYRTFADFGDAGEYRRQLPKLRRALRDRRGRLGVRRGRHRTP